jgi:hypothetical protein
MANLDLKSFSEYLSQLDFRNLFTQVLGWNNAPSGERDWQEHETKEIVYVSRMVAELAGVAVVQVVTTKAFSDETTRRAVWAHISQSYYENLLIFTDQETNPSQSLWYWVKRTKDAETGKPKNIPRKHEYFKGQPVDLFASKLQAMVVELSELDAAGRLPVLEVARRMENALDVEKTTKRFFTRYQEQHQALLDAIEGIDDERDRRWYASVILNRLMFVWFLQKKRFLDNANIDYLTDKLAASQRKGNDLFFAEFLVALFFEAFAKPESQRTTEAKALTGSIPYLNGGLFLPHKLELDAQHQIRIGKTLHIKDTAFAGVFEVFDAFSWSLDDTPGGQSDEINPDVLGYIFEKYINQKAFGAYYTKPEITNYLAERSIHQLVLERIKEPAQPLMGWPAVEFDSIADLLANMDARVALKLVNEVLPNITILDPAVGSGAFLVAALKALINIYYAIVGRAELGASAELQHWLKHIQKDHPSVGYYIKRKIVTDNLYGVDIMEEACEIAKLRLFLAMVSSVREVDDLEPLPNIDFNIIPGNSLVGLMRVDAHEFDQKQDDLFKPKFRDLLTEKNRKLDIYKHTALNLGKETNLRQLRDDIDAEMDQAKGVLNELLRDQFEGLGVKFEQATWDNEKQTLGKPVKRKITTQDIAEQTPMHWGYVFDAVMHDRGGFDIILTNPPWEIFKPIDKEFAKQYDPEIERRGTDINDFDKRFKRILENENIKTKYLAYLSSFPHVSEWIRNASDYKHQFSLVNGRKTGGDINLYKLFTERVYYLLRQGGFCGIVIPSGIYSDLGAKGLRDLLFDHTHIEGLFCFENRKEIFENVHRSFKFVVLTFEKVAAGDSQHFPAAFMRHDVAELNRFPVEGSLEIDVALIRRLSPDSHSVMEFKSSLDVQIAEKMLRYPLLGEEIEGTWNLKLTNEFHMTNDSRLFKTEPTEGRLPLYEGKMIWHFEHGRGDYRYWLDRKEVEDEETNRRSKRIAKLLANVGTENRKHFPVSFPFNFYRLGFRSITGATNERALVVSILPKQVVTGNSLTVSIAIEDQVVNGLWHEKSLYSVSELLVINSLMSSFVCDWFIRQKILTNMNMFYVYQIPMPRLTNANSTFHTIVERAAKLICTSPEFDELAKEVGLGSHNNGVSEPLERARLRAELDGLIAHLYGLTEAEFAHILTTFPLVEEPVKVAALNAYRDVERGLIQ